jgi:membrane protease YdiL (CAAX protease family)
MPVGRVEGVERQALRSDRVAPTAAPMSRLNRTVAAVLRSPVSGLLDSGVLLLTLRGRRSGREITLPAQWAAGTDALWICPGRPEGKRWWRNLRTEAPVALRLLGRDVPATARVVMAGEEFAEGAAAYRARFRHGDPAGAGVLVRVDVPAVDLLRARGATVVPGSGVAASVRRHPLAAFFLLTYLLSWGYWVPVALAGGHTSHFPGLLGPMVAALLLTPLVAGRAGLADLLRRMGRWRAAPRWYAAALVPFAAALVGAGFLALLDPDRPPWRDGRLAQMPGLPEAGWLGVLALVLVVNGYGEETGWRGYAWPRLRERHGIAGAALLLTVPWALWHLPTFFVDSGMRGFPPLMLPGFLVGMAAGAVVLGWLYERSGASLPVVVVFHSMLNMGSATRATEGLPAACASAAVIVWAVLILRREHARDVAARSGPRTA